MSRSTHRTAALLVAALALAGCSSGPDASAPSPGATEPSPGPTADSPGQALRPVTVGAPLSTATLLTHAVNPVLAADDAGGLLLAAEPGTIRGTRSVLAAFRDAGGRWSGPTVVARGAQGPPTVAAGGNGRAAVGWTTNGSGAMTESVRLRDPAGRWEPAHVVARDADFTVLTSLDMNRRGDVAALAANGERFRVVSRRAGGRWTTTPVPGCTMGTLALDDRGVVHVACTGYVDRGEQGEVGVWTQRIGGPLQLERRLGKAVSVALQVAPDGRETIGLGVGVPGDSEVVAPTTFRVLRQASPGGPLSTVWSRSRTSTMQVAGAGDRLLVAWEEPRGRRPRTATLLRVQQVLPTAGPVTTVRRDASSASGRGDDGFDYDLAVPARGPGVLVWRIWRNASLNKVTSTRLTPLVGTATGPTVRPPGARDVVDQSLSERQQLAVSATGEVDLAWLHDAVTRRNGIGDRDTVDGTVEVARLHP